MQHVTDTQRRSRLAVRHALAPQAHVSTPEDATTAMTAMHATEPASVYLSYWARIQSLDRAEVDRALYSDRSLVKQLAMRRTVFVFPRDLLPATLPSASARVALTERARIAKDVVTVGIAVDGNLWLDRARAAVLAQLEKTPEGLTAAEIRLAVPTLDVKVSPTGGEAWGAPRILTQLGASGDIFRGANTGRWRTSRPRWTSARHWLGAEIEHLDAQAGYREIVRRWLFSFGPATEGDLVWWLGATKSIVRQALADVGAVAVSLDRGAIGWLLPDDLDEVADPGAWTGLLPVLDPTVMGWRDREFYLGNHAEALFEKRGNAGTTAWVNGRIVGCWIQDARATVQIHLVDSITKGERQALDGDARRLTEWLDGETVGTIYMSPAMRLAVANHVEQIEPAQA